MPTLSRFRAWGLILIPALGLADGPTRLKLTERTEINAPPAKVWEMIKDFCSISNWHPAIASCVSKGGNAAGAERVLTLKQEGTPRIDEEMLAYDEGGDDLQIRDKKGGSKGPPGHKLFLFHERQTQW